VMTNLPELPEKRIERLRHEYGISDENARKIVDWDIEELFVSSQREHGMPLGKFLRLYETITMLSREGIVIDDPDLIDSFMALHEKVPLESYEDILRHAHREGCSVDAAIDSLGISQTSEEQVRKVILDVIGSNAGTIDEKGMDAFKPLMGKVMAELKGKSDGKTISAILHEELERIIK